MYCAAAKRLNYVKKEGGAERTAFLSDYKGEKQWKKGQDGSFRRLQAFTTVSYTHLDVYKRQVQYAQHYFPIKIRAALIPITTIGSNVAIPLAIIGLFMGLDWLVNLGILLFLAVVLFQLVTLPVEFNASRRALRTLETESFLTGEELAGAKKVLSAAALTYVAALVVAVANLLRLILLRLSLIHIFGKPSLF